LQVESSMTVGITENGSETFMRVLNKDGTPATQPSLDASGNPVLDPVTGAPQTKPVSVFDAVKRMIDYLETPKTTATKTEYDAALDNLNSSLDHISRARASVGARETQLTALKAASDDLDTQYQSTLSGLQDLDYTAAISKFTQQNTQLQAAQQTFMKVTQTNLFSML
jgi:flagellar hook-associated protein 3 FlgL